MNAWWSVAEQALEVVVEPVTFFVRDDDVGWADERLFTVLDIFSDLDLPIDLAVIPRALTPPLAERLLGRRQRIDFHQHGYAHMNHEPVGRKCEFGAARGVAEQRADIAHGRECLQALFGARLQPIFTPPWNRCTRQTGECLRELGFVVLSRDASASALDVAGLVEVPITFDWFAKRKGAALSLAERGALLTGQIATSSRVGIMLHHAQMAAEDLTCLRELLEVLANHRRARVSSMSEVANVCSIIEVCPGRTYG
jgi:predicted deacetylase